MALFPSSSPGHQSRVTTVRYLAVAALGFTAFVIIGVVRHSGLIEPHEPRRTSAREGSDGARLGLGQGVDVGASDGTTASSSSSRRRQHVRQKPVLEKATRPAPRLGGTPFPAFDGVKPAVYRYEIVNKFPHDPTAFTQGFLYSHPDTIFESTGSVGGPSTVREVSLTTGEVRRKTELDNAYFAEGLTMHEGKLAQITWRNNRGFYYDPKTLKRTGDFATPLRDGWGLTVDPAGDSGMFIVTDASKHLHFIDPRSDPMSLHKSTVVTDGDKVVRFTNELETIGGEVWANVLERDCIARIDPDSGKVVGWIVMDDLKSKQDPAPGTRGVLNGIAYDPDNDRIFVTGKQWSNVFEIRLVEMEETTTTTTTTEEEAITALEQARRTCWPADSLPSYGYP